MASSHGTWLSPHRSPGSRARLISEEEAEAREPSCLAPDHPAGKQQSQRGSPGCWLQAPPAQPRQQAGELPSQ